MLRERNKELGILVILGGIALLLSLRMWTSPLTRQATGNGSPGLFEFLMIPLFLIVVGIGTALFLWEPDSS